MLMRELSAKVLRSSKVKGSIRSQRKRCALEPAFRTAVTHRIFPRFWCASTAILDTVAKM